VLAPDANDPSPVAGSIRTGATVHRCVQLSAKAAAPGIVRMVSPMVLAASRRFGNPHALTPLTKNRSRDDHGRHTGQRPRRCAGGVGASRVQQRAVVPVLASLTVPPCRPFAAARKLFDSPLAGSSPAIATRTCRSIRGGHGGRCRRSSLPAKTPNTAGSNAAGYR
jgi:hypothetical protein